MSNILRTVGIDISKDWLDAFAAPEGRASRFSNDRAGFRKLIAWIGSGADRIAYEPSGPFHRDLEDALLKAGLPLYAINPFQVRSFARSLGRRAKTDAVDARMLATMAAAIEDLHPTEARSEEQRDLAVVPRPASLASLVTGGRVRAAPAQQQGRFRQPLASRTGHVQRSAAATASQTIRLPGRDWPRPAHLRDPFRAASIATRRTAFARARCAGLASRRLPDSTPAASRHHRSVK